jgi:hypothetical protein
LTNSDLSVNIKVNQFAIQTSLFERISTMKDNINYHVQRTRQYWHVDGLAELVTGGIFLFLGAYFFTLSALPPNSLLNTLLQAGFALIFIGILLLGKRFVAALKARLTFPRTGFVEYRPPTRRSRWISAGLAFLMAALVVALMARAPASLAWMPAITSLIVAAGWLIFASRLGLPRFFLLAIASLAIGIGLSLAGLGDLLGLAIYYALMGFVLLLSGGLTLRSYLKQAPTPREEPDEA